MSKGDCIGKKFGRLTIVSEYWDRDRKTTYCKTICDCGNTHIAQKGHLKSGNIKSCGCLVVDTNRKLLNRLKHNMAHTKQYSVWEHIKQRCGNKKCRNYKNYGGRGITYDPKWETFEGFWEDMKEGYREDLTIDRIDNNGNYCKENCRWATKKQQQNNKRNNHYLEYNGEKRTISQWERKQGFNRNTIYSRLKRGWSIKDAILIKPQRSD
jgi:hypothetical protein